MPGWAEENREWTQIDANDGELNPEKRTAEDAEVRGEIYARFRYFR